MAKTVTIKEAKAIAKELIRTHGRGFDWSSYRNPKLRKSISPQAKVTAMTLFAYNPKLLNKLRKELKIELKCNVHADWITRAFALLCDPDDNGNTITVDLLRAAEQYRIKNGLKY